MTLRLPNAFTDSDLARLCPTSFDTIRLWAAANSQTLDQALRRFLWFAILDSAMAEPNLAQNLILRGSAAFPFYCPGFRPSRDLDFMHLGLPKNAPPEALDRIKQEVSAALKKGLPNRFPPSIGWQDFLRESIHLEVVPVLYPTPWNEVQLPPPSGRILRIYPIEYLIAQKLRGLIRQPTYGVARPQDVFDFAMLQAHYKPQFDPAKVISHFDRHRKIIQGEPGFSADRFDDTIRQWAKPGFAAFAQSVDSNMTFAEAWTLTMEFVRAIEAAR